MLLVSVEARADRWYEHYARAEQAIAERRWRDAVTELNEALERRGDSGARVRSYGMKVVAYFPYLRLGVAYYHLGQYEAALQAFDTEERLGAVQDDELAMAMLERYRGRARQALDEAAAAVAERRDAVVRQALDEAAEHEAAGRLDQAMEAVARALAVDSEQPQAVATMQRLRELAAERDARQRVQQRIADLTERGRSASESGDAATAVSLLRQALELGDDDTARTLLQRAEARLRSEATAARSAERVDSLLADANQLGTSGRIEDALARLETVLAMDPGNTRATSLRDRLLEAQRASALAAEIARLTSDADDAFVAGRWERAISASNQVLALEPGNASAVATITRAYHELSRRMLGGAPAENLPPAIRFADLRDDRADGSRTQIVRRPELRVSGVVIDSSPVELEVRADDGLPVTVVRDVQSVGDMTVTEFRIDHQLPPGPTSLSVVATDDEGLSTRSEYVAEYRRPLLRTPWVMASLASVPVLAAAAVMAARSRRRRRLRRRRFNPYIAGAPVLDADLFFGRDALVDRILDTIHNNSLLLHGERRIGKTSLLHHVKRRLEALDDPEYAFFPVYVDLQGTPEERFFATLSEDVLHELSGRLYGLDASRVEDEGYGYRELVRDLREVIRQLEAGTDKRVKLVLLVDEVDELNAYDPRINQRLRSLFMKSFAEHLVAVVAGVRIRREWEQEASPWYNFFEEIEVLPLDRRAAARLVIEPIEGVFGFDSDAVDRIVEHTGGRPYPIQKLCVAVINRLHEQGRRRATAADVDAVRETAAT